MFCTPMWSACARDNFLPGPHQLMRTREPKPRNLGLTSYCRSFFVSYTYLVLTRLRAASPNLRCSHLRLGGLPCFSAFMHACVHVHTFAVTDIPVTCFLLPPHPAPHAQACLCLVCRSWSLGGRTFVGPPDPPWVEWSVAACTAVSCTLLLTKLWSLCGFLPPHSAPPCVAHRGEGGLHWRPPGP